MKIDTCAFGYTFRAQNASFQVQNSKCVFGKLLPLHVIKKWRYQKVAFSNTKDYQIFILDLGPTMPKTQI